MIPHGRTTLFQMRDSSQQTLPCFKVSKQWSTDPVKKKDLQCANICKGLPLKARAAAMQCWKKWRSRDARVSAVRKAVSAGSFCNAAAVCAALPQDRPEPENITRGVICKHSRGLDSLYYAGGFYETHRFLCLPPTWNSFSSLLVRIPLL